MFGKELAKIQRRIMEARIRRKLNKPAISSCATKLKNPYTLYWYKADWSEKQTAENNTKYWEWEIKYNGFKCP